jgi:hypothetical protein
MLAAGLARFHDEFVHPLRLVRYVLTTAKAINGQPYCFVKRTRFHFNRVLHAI